MTGRDNMLFGFLLHDVFRRLGRLFDVRGRGLALTLPDCRVLTTLARSPGTSQSALAALADTDAMTISRIADRLTANGLIQRRFDAEDRRVRRLYLTHQADAVLDSIERLVELTITDALSGIGKEEKSGFMDVLSAMYRNQCEARDTAPLHEPPGVLYPTPKERIE